MINNVPEFRCWVHPSACRICCADPSSHFMLSLLPSFIAKMLPACGSPWNNPNSKSCLKAASQAAKSGYRIKANIANISHPKSFHTNQSSTARLDAIADKFVHINTTPPAQLQCWQSVSEQANTFSKLQDQRSYRKQYQICSKTTSFRPGPSCPLLLERKTNLFQMKSQLDMIACDERLPTYIQRSPRAKGPMKQLMKSTFTQANFVCVK